ncbi:MAG: metal ABC transporter solute-binding protein, Zn/Mn family [Actinomycetota bacterium]
MRTPLLRALGGLIIAPVLTLAGCVAGTGADPDRPQIIATTVVWGNVIEEIVGEEATVEVLIPAGADVHGYQPTSQQIASLQTADLVVANGLGLEEGLLDVLASAVSDGANVLELAPQLDPLPFASDAHGEGEEDDHVSEGRDPHVWFDPDRVVAATKLIASSLAEVDDSIDWAARAAAYSDRLLEADREIEAILDAVPQKNRKLVTNHDAMGYFADRYGFEIIAVVIPGGSTLGDPSSAEMAELVEEINDEGVLTIFAETSQPTRLAEAVAAEVGDDISVVELYTGSLGEPGSEADTLIGMLAINARRIADALSG